MIDEHPDGSNPTDNPQLAELIDLRLDRRRLLGGVAAASLVGFVGSFTTFSTFIFEVGMQVRDSQWFAVLGNMVGQNVIGVLALVGGLSLAKLAA